MARIKRHVSGLLLLDKGLGISSNGALQKAKWLYQASKAGHTGNLDPAATGLLPICLGEATKFSQFLLDADKTYEATLRLGATSTTGDGEGEITERGPVSADRGQIEKVLRQFLGPIEQLPPMYSALKFQGKALYHYARAGVEIEREKRTVNIYDIRLVDQKERDVSIVVRCSKGTYIRTLAEDIGEVLGCGAYLSALRRTSIGELDIARAHTVEALEQMTLEDRDALLMPFDLLVTALPSVSLDADSAHYFQHGQAVWRSKTPFLGLVRVYDERQDFLGTGEVALDGRVHPRRLVVPERCVK